LLFVGVLRELVDVTDVHILGNVPPLQQILDVGTGELRLLDVPLGADVFFTSCTS
jgi:hypothetical protein